MDWKTTSKAVFTCRWHDPVCKNFQVIKKNSRTNKCSKIVKQSFKKIISLNIAINELKIKLKNNSTYNSIKNKILRNISAKSTSPNTTKHGWKKW